MIRVMERLKALADEAMVIRNLAILHSHIEIRS